MRILHFCNFADLVGGAEVYAHSLIDALRERGHQVALFGASPDREIDQPELRVVRRPFYDRRRLVRDSLALDALREFVTRFRPEIVHAHNVYSVALEVLQYLGSSGTPLVQTVHDFQLLCPNSWCVRGDGTPCPGGAGDQCFRHQCQQNHPYDAWDVLLAVYRQRLISNAVRTSVAPSSYLVERLVANGWRDVRHLPYFIDLPGVATAAPRADNELLYVGRLEPEKGVRVLLEALPHILADIPRARLSVLGSGSQLPALRRHADHLRLGSAIRFLSKQPRNEIATYYANSTVCILPSIWSENSPLVAYECLAAGLPMIGSRLGGLPELIENGCGLTFTPRDPRDLARAVVRFLRLPTPERERMSKAATDRARSFERNRHLDSIECLYSEVVTSRSPAPPSTLEPELLSSLHHAGMERIAHESSPKALQMLRVIARSLKLPKVLKS